MFKTVFKIMESSRENLKRNIVDLYGKTPEITAQIVATLTDGEIRRIIDEFDVYGDSMTLKNIIEPKQIRHGMNNAVLNETKKPVPAFIRTHNVWCNPEHRKDLAAMKFCCDCGKRFVIYESQQPITDADAGDKDYFVFFC